jgi:hypothetical protein
LHELDLLPEEWRRQFVERATVLAVETLDADFLGQHIRNVFSDDEVQLILTRVESERLPDLAELVSEWEENHKWPEDPDEYFGPLVEALGVYFDAFPEGGPSRSKIMDSLSRIEDVSENIREIREQEEAEERARYEPDYDYYDAGYGPSLPSERSIFDDVNE